MSGNSEIFNSVDMEINLLLKVHGLLDGHGGGCNNDPWNREKHQEKHQMAYCNSALAISSAVAVTADGESGTGNNYYHVAHLVVIQLEEMASWTLVLKPRSR